MSFLIKYYQKQIFWILRWVWRIIFIVSLDLFIYPCSIILRRRSVTVINTTQLHSTKSELRLCAGSNPFRRVLKISDVENLWQWFRLEIRLNEFCRSTTPQKQFNNFHHHQKENNFLKLLQRVTHKRTN